MEAHTWRADVNSFPSLDGQLEFGPAYAYEYNTRATYGANITWPTDAPLNATVRASTPPDALKADGRAVVAPRHRADGG
jgi:hypothetical protein